MAKAMRVIFLVIFILSSILGCVLLLYTPMIYTSAPAQEHPAATPGTIMPTPDSGKPITSNEPANSGSFALVTSLATSFASLVGFITTTVITWRKEKRDSDLAAMERKKLELELEKNRLELEELKKKKSENKE